MSEYLGEEMQKVGRKVEALNGTAHSIESAIKALPDRLESRLTSFESQIPSRYLSSNLEQLSSIENRLENILDSIRKSKTFDESPIHEIRNCLNELTKTLNYVFFVLMIQLGVLCLFVVKVW